MTCYESELAIEPFVHTLELDLDEIGFRVGRSALLKSLFIWGLGGKVGKAVVSSANKNKRASRQPDYIPKYEMLCMLSRTSETGNLPRRWSEWA